MFKRFQSLFSPVDIASLVVFRIAFGAIMLWEVVRYFQYDRIYYYFIAPEFFFTYQGFEWISPWPGMGMYVHFALLGMLSVFILIGLFYRISAFLFFIGFTYIFLLDQTNYLNHFYLISLLSFMMIWISPHRSFSLDAIRNPEIRSDTVPVWMVGIMRFLVGVPYFFGGIAKINVDWLQGEPMREWLANRSADYSLGFLFTQEWFVYFISYGGLLFDLLVVPFLLIKRTRMLAFLTAILFHLANSQLFSIGIFPWFMIAATTIFFEPSWPRTFFKSFPLYNQRIQQTSYQKLTVGFLSLFVVVQLLLPFRHVLYPGMVHWTEEGHRFSWHMKLRDKIGKGVFILYWPKTDEIAYVDPNKFLTPRQVRKMFNRPEMILVFSHYLYKKVNDPEVQVFADVVVSLNGRPFSPLTDVEVDLSKQSRSVLPYSWILPLDENPKDSSIY